MRIGDSKPGAPRTYEEVLASEISYRRLFEAAQDGILILDVETGRVADVNPFLFDLLGFSREEMVGKTVGELSPFKDIESNQAMLERLQEHGYVRYENLPLETRDGRKIAVEFVSNVYQAGARRVIQCNVRDITERKKAEAQFLRAQRMESIGTLAGGIAHDLNNVLTPIMLSVEILKTMSYDPRARAILDGLEVSARRGADIVRQILSLARGLEGERIVQPRHLLEELEKIIEDTFSKDLRLQFSVPNETWTILGDSSQVHQILLNLCVNACEASPHQNELTISVENNELDQQYANVHIQARVGRYVTLNITDGEVGIAQEDRDKILALFFPTSRSGHDLAPPSTLPRGHGETILLVDDEASILTITSQTLQAFGFHVLTAQDGAEAVAIYAQHRTEIDVVLTDMMMPVMDGPTIIKVLRKINPHVRIVGSSGLHANDFVAKGIGVEHFLPKPYSPEALLKVMQAALAEV